MTNTEIAKVFKAFCDERRVEIIKKLSDGEKCACNLLEDLDISQPTLSHHMKILCDSGVVLPRKEGKWTHYRLCDEGIAVVRTILDSLICEGETGSKSKVDCIKVLGGGCSKCEELEANATKAVSQMGLDCKVEYITDFAEIGALGIMKTPALVINDKIISAGKVLSVKDITNKIAENLQG